MPNQITDTGIVAEAYNGRGLFAHRADTHNLIRTSSGTLWAAVRENLTNKWINIYRSDDNGFTWTRKYQGNLTNSGFRKAGIAGLNHNGNFMHLTYHEHEDRLILWHSYYDAGASPSAAYGIEPFVFDVDANGNLTRTTTDGATDTINADQDQLAFHVTYNTDTVFLVFAKVSAITVLAYKPYIQASPQGEWSHGSTFFNVLSAVVDENNILHIAALKDLDTHYNLIHVSLNKNSGTFSEEHIIEAQADTLDIVDVSIDMDSHGSLGVAYTKITSDNDANATCAVSADGGNTWAVKPIPTTVGQHSFTDAIVSEDTAKTSIMGGIGGFLLAYTRDHEELPTSYVRSLLSDDGLNYTLGEQRKVVDTDEPVAGVKFFRAPAAQLQDFSDLGHIRVAYQIGEGNSPIQLDTVPVTFGQGLLDDYAYPEESITYTTDEPEDGQVVISFNIVDSVSENVDYYDLGLTGSITARYQGAFRKVGTKTRLERYEPLTNSLLADRTSYELEGAYVEDAVWEVITYEIPFATDESDFDTYIEKDIRKVFLPPQFHLTRTMILNQGNYLKRTVWLAYYGGNAYELTQVVPHFIDNQICLYTANAYVVGPSRDPFARNILPSET